MTEAAAPSPGRLPSLTALRFVAALLVFVFHAHYLGIFGDTSVQKAYTFVTSSAGGIGVSFFFVLSGFVLTWAVKPADTMGKFWRRRFFKIFPSHVVVWTIVLAMLFVSGTAIEAGPATANLFLVNAWVPDMNNLMFAVNGVTWSLSAEIAFYLLFPFLITGINRIRANRLWFWAIAVSVLALSVPLLSKAFLPDAPIFPGYDQFSWPQMWFAYQFPLVRCLEFIVGILFARIVLSGRWVRLGLGPAALGVLAMYVAALWLPPLWSFAAPYAFPLGLLVAAAAAADLAGRGTLLTRRPLVWSGEISYAFFLIHLNVLNSAQAALKGQWMGYGAFERTSLSTPVAVLFLLGCLAVSIVLAWLLHRCVEMPVTRRWSSSRPHRPPVPAVDTGEVKTTTTTG
ncbi:acyltransferase [Streptomyces sp. ISL-111]|uniref:acyltransferase family protein n=1 Tax=unclassified Streptomyces TaxID=2593676 RepID=UPI001BEB0F33|nr:acyltransferase [Streptomyces sp. ISL-111]MBT2379729.1 acyltransferase [Streptomyces sp. ISL-111]